MNKMNKMNKMHKMNKMMNNRLINNKMPSNKMTNNNFKNLDNNLNLEFKEINNKEVWEKFLAECEEKSFLQSWNWGEFQKMMGDKIWRLGVYDEEKMIGVALVVKVKAKRGTFLLVPHGPVLAEQFRQGNFQFPISNDQTNFKFQILKSLIDKLKEMARQEKASFIRVAPIWLARRSPQGEGGERIFRDSGFRDAPMHIHPEITWELDIAKPEEEILMGMRKTTRYLIKQAQKNPDIEIIQSQNIEDIKIFNQIYQETAWRHHFVPFSFDYLKNEFSAFKNDNQISLFLGKYKDRVVSSAMIIYWQNSGFYHQGASLAEYNKIPVSYLLQWEAIKEAKKRGCQIYNFWGIALRIRNWELGIGNLKKHPWAGLTLFKMGFGGYRKEYVKTQDFPLSKKYFLTYFFEKIRKIKRRL